MSCTTLYGFRNGQREQIAEYSNAWGFCPMVWDALVNKYQTANLSFDFRTRVSRLSLDAWPELWRKVESKEVQIQPWELMVLQSTYDRALVGSDLFEPYVAALEQFQMAFAISDRVCHLSAIAGTVRRLPKEIQSIGFHGTSVSEDLWWVIDGEDGRPYDLNVDTGHWYLKANPD